MAMVECGDREIVEVVDSGGCQRSLETLIPMNSALEPCTVEENESGVSFTEKRKE